MSFSASNPAAIVSTAVQKYANIPGGLMPLLHEIQRSLGHVPKDCVAAIATGMRLSRAEVHGVISFYHDFHTSPQGRTTIHDWVDSGRRAFQSPESLYTLRPFHIVSIESWGIVPTSF